MEETEGRISELEDRILEITESQASEEKTASENCEKRRNK